MARTPAESDGAMRRRRLVTALSVGAMAIAGIVTSPLQAHAAPVQYWFTGNPGNADDGTRTAGSPSASFSSTAPTGAAPSTQTSNPALIPTPCGDAKVSYWTGTFNGTLTSGTLHFDWWWQTANPAAIAQNSALDVYICANGQQVGGLNKYANGPSEKLPIGPTPTESTFDAQITLSAPLSNPTLLIEASPHYLDVGQQNTVVYNSASEPSFFTFTAGAAPTPTPTPVATPTATPITGGATGNQLFANFPAPYPYPHEPPPPSAVALLFGEPSLGVDWGSNTTMYQGDLNTWAVNFAYSKGALPVATWNDRSDTATDVSSLDARLITDHAGNASDRTLVAQLHGLQSIEAYTDTDGGTAAPPANSADWTPESSGGIPSGADHESIGSGRYALPLPTGAGTVYPHAIYYCSQTIVGAGPYSGAFCARSDTGGATWGQGTQMYTNQCGGLHGKPRVGPDGTVYVPNKDCSSAGGASAAKGVLISKDNGATWTLVNIPHTSTDANQPDPDVAVGGSTGMGTVYYAYRDGDHHAKVVVSNDDGSTWSTPTDVGAFFGIQNAQFPEVIAGDADRAAVTFLGTPQGSTLPNGNGQGDNNDDMSDNFGCPSSTATNCGARWDLYVSYTYDGGKTWQTVDATPNDPVQRGGVCMQGTGCTGSDRNMLDFNDENIDNQGRVQVAYTDGCTGPCVTSNSDSNICSTGNQNCKGKFSSVYSMVDQTCGFGLFAKFDPGFNNDPACVPVANTPEFPVATPIAVGFGATAAVLATFVRRRRRRGSPAPLVP